MKSHSAHLRPVAATLLASTALLILGIMGSPPALGAEANPQELREKAETLQREARELKAGGKHEQAQEVLRKAMELRAEADRLQRGGGPAEESRRPRPEELKQRLEQARAQLKAAREAGREEEVARLERQVARMEAVLERSDRPAPEWMRPPREGGPGRGFPGAPMDRPELQQLRHLEAAIGNLHAAGLHEPAECLAQQAQEMRQKLGLGERPDLAPRPMEGELKRLRMEVQELRRMVRDLGERLDQLTRERRQPPA